MKICETCGATYEGRPSICPMDRGRLREVDDPLVGREVGATYTIEARIGQGSIATVYRARRRAASTDRVALKVLAPAMSASPKLRERFLREARAAGRLRHAHLVELFDAGETVDGLVYLAMELAPGSTLARAIGGCAMEPRDALGIAAQLAGALACAHQLGVVHRDVKPANVLVTRAPFAEGGWMSKLVDFGLASVRGERRLTATGELLGSPSYMAPEQVEGRAPTPAVDVYALGCVLFEMSTGRPPFVGSTPRVLDAHVVEAPLAPSAVGAALPAWADRLVLAMLGKGPESRPSAADVARDLRRLV